MIRAKQGTTSRRLVAERALITVWFVRCQSRLGHHPHHPNLGLLGDHICGGSEYPQSVM